MSEPEILATYPELHESIKLGYHLAWARRAKLEDKPEWIMNPPLTFAHVPFDRDLWNELQGTPLEELLFTEGDMGMGEHEYWGDETFPIEEHYRDPRTYLTYNFWTGREEFSEIGISFSYRTREGYHIGSQSVELYNGSQPSVYRKIQLYYYMETGYEGHKLKVGTLSDEIVSIFQRYAEEGIEIIRARNELEQS